MKAGASVSIPWIYSQQYRNHVKYLCEGNYWSSCSYTVKTNSQRDSNKYSISDDKSQSIFTVTIKQLTSQNTYYWCAVEIDGGADHGCYFHLSVTTGSRIIDGTRVTLNKRGDNRFTVTLSELSPESSGWYYCAKGDFQMPVHLTVTEKPKGLQPGPPSCAELTLGEKERGILRTSRINNAGRLGDKVETRGLLYLCEPNLFSNDEQE
ncbi:uncharacterized protein LOC119430329 [Nematolebias whitei]|uniref:uncharacterized protein LOC119430329 n=1 Tax=Nematolebias whitei TaxID=451745 RepID=UPI001897B7B9|nr:uncharacterized protein LOC119430329 [Nematolebias whitei]